MQSQDKCLIHILGTYGRFLGPLGAISSEARPKAERSSELGGQKKKWTKKKWTKKKGCTWSNYSLSCRSFCLSLPLLTSKNFFSCFHFHNLSKRHSKKAILAKKFFWRKKKKSKKISHFFFFDFFFFVQNLLNSQHPFLSILL